LARQFNGGHIIGENYRDCPRFRLLKIARNNSHLIDAQISAFLGSDYTFDWESRPIETEFDIGEHHSASGGCP
jgi:hypothetical protein